MIYYDRLWQKYEINELNIGQVLQILSDSEEKDNKINEFLNNYYNIKHTYKRMELENLNAKSN